MINVSQEDCTRTKSPPKIIREGELEIVGLTDDFPDWKIILSFAVARWFFLTMTWRSI